MPSINILMIEIYKINLIECILHKKFSKLTLKLLKTRVLDLL